MIQILWWKGQDLFCNFIFMICICGGFNCFTQITKADVRWPTITYQIIIRVHHCKATLSCNPSWNNVYLRIIKWVCCITGIFIIWLREKSINFNCIICVGFNQMVLTCSLMVSFFRTIEIDIKKKRRRNKLTCEDKSMLLSMPASCYICPPSQMHHRCTCKACRAVA